MDGKLVLGRRIREIRESQKTTLVEFSDRSGVSYAYLKAIETQGRQPSGRIVHMIGDALGVDIEEFTSTRTEVELAGCDQASA